MLRSKWFVGALCLAAVFVTGFSSVMADPSVDRLIRALENDDALSPETREALIAIAREMNTSDGSMTPGMQKVAERLTVKADARFRHEASVAQDSRKDRYRNRTRVRIGVVYALSEDMQFGVRMITGTATDANSPHHTFGTGFDSLPVSLDRVYLKAKVRRVEGMTVTIGKFAHPFARNPVYGALAWDSDVHPEGAAIAHKVEMGESVFTFHVGQYILIEQSGSDAGMTCAQLTGECAGINFALGYYWYNSTTPDGSTVLLADNQGNELDATGTAFKADFHIFNPIIWYTFDVDGMPITISAEGLRNTTTGDHANGWAFGVKVGDKSDKLVQFYYQFSVVQENATFSPFSGDDALLPVNRRGHITGVKKKLTSNVDVHVYALITSRWSTDSTATTTDSDKDQFRGRVDVNFKF